MGRRRRGALAALAALIMLVGGATPASAHYVYQKDEVWEGGDGKCVRAYSEISHGNNDNGYSKVVSTALKRFNTPSGSYDCTYNWKRPPGELSARAVVYRWVNNTWQAASATSFRYNVVEGNELTVTSYWDLAHNAYYGTSGGAWATYNGDFKGGYQWSGSHFLNAEG